MKTITTEIINGVEIETVDEIEVNYIICDAEEIII